VQDLALLLREGSTELPRVGSGIVVAAAAWVV